MTLGLSAVLVGIGVPAAADTNGSRGDCTRTEYRAIHKGDTIREVRRILGGRGIVDVPGNPTRRWGVYDLSRKTGVCLITFDHKVVALKLRLR